MYDLTLDDTVLTDLNHPVGLALSLIPPHSRVLELGCATGYVTRLLVEHKRCQVSGVELMPAAAALAQPFCSDLIVGDLEEQAVLDRIAGPFDVILAGDVLEHLRSPDRLLTQLRTQLAPSGFWVISVPNVAHWSVRKELLRGRFNYSERGIMDASHLRWFTVETLAAMVQSCGYRVQRQEAVYSLPWQGPLRLRRVSRWLRAKGWGQGLFGYQIMIQAGLAQVIA